MNKSAILLLAEISKGKAPLVRNFVTDFEAYEKFQLIGYITEIIEIHRKGEYYDHRGHFHKLANLALAMDVSHFYEMGSTLFSTIDMYSKFVGMDKSLSTTFVGIEPSKLLSDTAEILHSQYTLTHYASHVNVEVKDISKAVHRSFQATSYAFLSAVDLANWLSQFGASQDGIWFSEDDRDQEVAFLGNRLTLFSFSKFVEVMHEFNYKLEILSAKLVRHRDFSIYEIFINSYRPDIVSGEEYSAEFEADEIKNIPACLWLEERIVPLVKTSLLDILKHPRELNFAGIYSELC